MKLEGTILDAVTRASGCRVEEVVYLFPHLMWNEVFGELDYLIRNGKLRLLVDGRGVTVRTPDENVESQHYT